LPHYLRPNPRRNKFILPQFPAADQPPILPTLKSADDLKSATVILDPNQLSTNGSTTIDWFVPSLDGKLVAVSLSQNGSEEGTLYVYETATGQKRPEAIPRVQFPTGGGSAAWNADGSGIYYTRYPAKGE